MSHTNPAPEGDAFDIDRLGAMLIGATPPHRQQNNNQTTHQKHLIYQSSTTKIYRHGSDCGIKLVNISKASCVENEVRASKHLPPSCNARRIAKVEENGQELWVHFEWANGVTLEEWARSRKERCRDDMKARLHVAIAIAKSLCDFHEASIAHRKLSPTNVIIEETSFGVQAVLIDLTKSSILKGGEVHVDGISGDLRDMGHVFQILFGGANLNNGGSTDVGRRSDASMDEDEDTEEDFDADYNNRTKKRGKSSSQQAQAMEGMPLFVSALISGLLDSNSGGATNVREGKRYTSAKVVLNDLLVGLSKFDVYFRKFDWKEASMWNHHSSFYGRQAEMSTLTSSLKAVMDSGQPMMTSVSGHAGMGKSTLVHQLKKAIEAKDTPLRGHVIYGKFDMPDVGGLRSDLLLFSCLDNFFGRFVARESDDTKCKMKQRIMDTVGNFGISELVQSIPNLAGLVGYQVNTAGPSVGVSTTPQQLQRSAFLLCRLIASIPDKEHPVVLYLDDCQRCDPTTLSVIQTIVTDPDIRSFLFVGCYRDNESSSPIVENMVSEVASSGVNVFRINLGTFEKESVNMLISENLCMPPSLTKPLSAVIHTKTAGSPLFCANFLNDHDLIRFNLTSRTWEYDIESILMTDIPTSVIEHMKSQMSKLPPSYILVLKLGSCLGDHFDRRMFAKAKVKTDYDLEAVIPHVCQIGFLHEIDGRFIWAHDQIREAAYDLIPCAARESFHLLIGTRMLMNTPPDELDTAIFEILCQINKGIGLIQTHDQKYEIAQLNYLAGESCIKASSFPSAAQYFMSGIRLLPNRCWDEEYDLTVQLYNAAQDALFAMGALSSLRTLTSTLISNAKEFDDKVHSYKHRIRYLISKGQFDEAISECSSVLTELGEPLPKCEVSVLTQEHLGLQAMMSKFNQDAILGHKRMDEQMRLVEMELLHMAVTSANNCSEPRMSVILIIRMVKRSLEFGLCDVSAFAFACFGSLLIHGITKDYKTGCYCGKLAIKLLDELDTSNRFKAHVTCIVYTFINIWSASPFQASLDPLLDGYNAGCAIGDMEWAYWNIQGYCALALFTGRNLNTLQDEIQTYAKRAKQSKNLGATLGMVPFLAMALGLTGDAKTRPCAYRSFFGCSKEELYKRLALQNEKLGRKLMMYTRKFTCIFFEDMDGALETYTHIKQFAASDVRLTKTMPHITNDLMNGLLAFSQSRKNEKDGRNWAEEGESVMNTFQTWRSVSEWNFSNKTFLLEAEYYFDKDEAKACDRYDASVKAARDHRFVHEQGLANHKAAQFHLHHGRKKDAQMYFAQARSCYETWGARSLVEYVDSQLEALKSSS